MSTDQEVRKGKVRVQFALAAVILTMVLGCQTEKSSTSAMEETDFWAEDLGRQFFYAKDAKDWSAVYELIEPKFRSRVTKADYVACLSDALGSNAGKPPLRNLSLTLNAERLYEDPDGRPIWIVTLDIKGVQPREPKIHWDEVTLVYDKRSFWVRNAGSAEDYRRGACE